MESMGTWKSNDVGYERDAVIKQAILMTAERDSANTWYDELRHTILKKYVWVFCDTAKC